MWTTVLTEIQFVHTTGAPKNGRYLCLFVDICSVLSPEFDRYVVAICVVEQHFCLSGHSNRLNVRQSDRLNVSLFVQIADWYKMSIAYEPTYQLIRLMHFVSDCCKADLYPTHVETSGN